MALDVYMTDWIDSVVKHSKTELNLLGLDQTKLGPLILDFIRDIQGSMGNQPTAIKSILKTIGHLVDQKPVAPITEKDFVNDKCVRCSYIYKSEDGKYYLVTGQKMWISNAPLAQVATKVNKDRNRKLLYPISYVRRSSSSHDWVSSFHVYILSPEG